MSAEKQKLPASDKDLERDRINALHELSVPERFVKSNADVQIEKQLIKDAKEGKAVLHYEQDAAGHLKSVLIEKDGHVQAFEDVEAVKEALKAHKLIQEGVRSGKKDIGYARETDTATALEKYIEDKQTKDILANPLPGEDTGKGN